MSNNLEAKQEFARIAENIANSGTEPEFGLIDTWLYALSGVLLLSILIFSWKNRNTFDFPNLYRFSMICFTRVLYIPAGIILFYVAFTHFHTQNNVLFKTVEEIVIIILISFIVIAFFIDNLHKKYSVIKSLLHAILYGLILEPLFMLCTFVGGTIVFLVPFALLTPFDISIHSNGTFIFTIPALCVVMISYALLRKHKKDIKKQAFKQIIIVTLLSLIPLTIFPILGILLH